MANIILPQAKVLDTISDNATMLVEENGEIKRYNVTSLINNKIKANARNLLDNSDFRNPVNQRGQTSFSTWGYTIDRWHLGSGSLTINNNSISINNGYLFQYIEHLDTTKQYTLAWCNNGVIAVQSNPIRTDIGSYPGIVLDCGWMNLDNVQWAALYEGEYTLDTLPEYQPKGYDAELLICRQYDPDTGEYIGLRKFGQPRNLLHNSDWRIKKRIINQRGQIRYTASGHSIDGWYLYYDDASLTVNDGYITLDGTNYYAWLVQYFDFGSELIGKKLTLAVKLKDSTPVVASGTLSTTKVSASIDGCTCYFLVNGGSGRLEVHLLASIGYVKNVEWAALYEDEYTIDTIPEYHPKDCNTELLVCQTQLQRFRTESERKTYCEDFRPTMRMTPNGMVSKFEQEIDGVTYYFASAEL